MKKLLLILTALFMLMGVAYAQLQVAELNPAYLDYLANPQNYEMPPVAYEPLLRDEDFEEATKEVLPTKYSMKDEGWVSRVGNQNPYGMCWAFAGCAAAEGAANMKYNTNTNVFSPLNMLNKNLYYGYLGLDTGGNYEHVMAYFYSNIGPVNEKDNPYKSPWTSPSTQPTKPGVVDNAYILSGWNGGFTIGERNAIKTHVLHKGAVDIAIYWDDSYLTYDQKSYYCSWSYGRTNHCVTVVGWDDTYSKNKFTNPPEADGAFLIKNSWGPDYHGDGYFWLSYYDKNAGQAMGVEYTKASKAPYNKIISHSKAVGSNYLVGAKYAKLIYAPSKAGTLYGIRTYIVDGGVTVKVTVKSGSSTVASTSFKTSYPGYMTKLFDTPYEYDDGEKLTVIVNYNTNAEVNKDHVPIESPGYNYTPEVKSGKTFASADGSTWKDMTEFECNVACGILVKDGASSTVKVTGVSVSPTSATLKVGGTKTITATVKPTNATNQGVTWTSSKTSVATVSSSGKVTAKGVGSATIRAKTKDGGYTATCKITVKEDTVKVTGVSLDKTTVKLKKGAATQLTATITPSDATNKEVTWSSSNKDVAGVGSSGKVSAYAPGTATITCKTKDGGYTATCKVTVYIAVTGVTVSPTSATLGIGDTKTIKATVKPSDATTKTVTWSSSNKSVATVTSAGKVTAVAKGSATITAKTKDGSFKATCKITVNSSVKVTGVTLDKTSITLKKGAATVITPTVKPTNATNKEVTWSSSNKEIAYVSSAGKVSAYADGTATITCKTKDGGYTATCKVTVNTPVTGITLNKTSATINKGKTIQLKATIKPEDATNKGITWTSSNTSVATVSTAGKVTGKAKGTATITAKTKDGGYKATCKVTVKLGVNSISVSPTSMKLKKGGAKVITATISPSDAENKTVYFYSSDTSVAGVGYTSGKVSAKGVGTATITAKTADGGYTATCKVTVYIPVTGVELNYPDWGLAVGESFTLKAKIKPSDATTKTVTWSSSNTNIATVSSSGKVTAKKEGEVVITVKTKDGGYTDKCYVFVYDQVIN